MKQHITIEQFEELSFDKQRKLFDALFPNIPEHPMSLRSGIKYGPVDINPEYLNIGRMIEFLDEHDKRFLEDDDRYEEGWHPWRINDANVMMWWGSNMEEDPAIELCDALWEAVKEVLNGK